MKTLMLAAALVAALMLIVTPVFAQGTKAPCQPSASAGAGASQAKAKAPEKIQGQVTKVDQKSGMLTVKAPDGSTHEFKGDAETLRDYKKGDRIELTLRAEPC
jgi:hypothetical protein